MEPESTEKTTQPHPGPPWADAASLAGLVVCQSWPLATVALLPALGGSHPLVLAAVNGSLAAVAVAAASSHSMAQALFLPGLVPVPLWLVINTTSWWAGWRFGPAAAERLARRRTVPENGSIRYERLTERLVDRHQFAVVAGAFLIPVPSALIHAGCGWRRMPWRRFVIADTLDILARDAVFALLGYSVKDQAVAAVHAITRVTGWIGALVIMLLGTAVIVTRIRHRSGQDTWKRP